MKALTTFILFILISSISNTYACTNLLVTKGASTDGSTFVSYTADSHTLYGELYFWAAAKHNAGAMRAVKEWDTGKPLGYIKEVAETYRVVGNMNEHSLAIGESTFGGRTDLVDTNGIMDYGSLIYVTLSRAKNAREAIKTMAELVAEYGYYSSGESFSIVDPHEVWILEMTGKGAGNKGAVWVAVRIPDGYISAHANQARIRTFTQENGTTSVSSQHLDKIFNPEVETVYAHDVVRVARDRGYFSGKDADFSFSDTYNPVDFGGARFCDARVWSFFREYDKSMDDYLDYAMGKNLAHRLPLYIKPDRKLDVHDVANAMRNHFEGTPLDMTAGVGAGPFKLPYRWRPMTWKYNGVDFIHERAVATQQTGWWFVAQCRSWLPNAVGGIFWFSVDDPATSCLSPVYCSITGVPQPYAVGNGDLLTYSETAAFWIFTRTTHFAYLRYDAVSADIRKVQQEWERAQAEKVKEIDQKALALYNKNKPKDAVKTLTDYSVKTAQDLMARWRQLDAYLLVKYADGNIKKETPDGQFKRDEYGTPVSPSQPPYPESWYKAIVYDAGTTLQAEKE
ncbi:MAG: C69 family dipeptidase [Prevotellaceae bacterium]|jgi:dipeptidase|nr:C69 family dipeptidase [Prevotellaceae bacterium]